MKHRNKWAKLLHRFEQTARYVEQGKQAFFKEYGISPTQYDVLEILYSADDAMSVRQIKSVLKGSDSDVSRVSDRLARANWVKKSPSKTDKRISLISITPEGVSIVERVMSDLHRLDELFFELSKSEVKTLNSLLKKIVQ